MMPNTQHIDRDAGGEGCQAQLGLFSPPKRAAPMDEWLDHLRTTARMATVAWRGDLLALPEQFPLLPPLPELLRQLREPAWPADAAFSRRQHVERRA